MRSSSTSRLRLAALVAVLCFAGQASAQSDEEARALYDAARLALQQQRFADAASYFQLAYERSGRAALLYNVGLAAERAGQHEMALTAFERFVEALPTAPEADRAREHIDALRPVVEEARAREAELEARRAAEEAARAAAEPEASDEASSDFSFESAPSPSMKRAVIATLAAGGASLAVGVVLLAVGQAKRARVEGMEVGTPLSEIEGDLNADRFTGAGAGMIALGAASAATGLALHLTRGPKRDGAVEVSLTPSGVSIVGSF